jgi:uncharacterized membrane protein
MAILIAGIVVFFVVHLFSAVRSRAPDRDLRQKLGVGPYMGIYSLISLVGFGMIAYGYGAARPATILYTPPSWGAHVNLVLMLPALILLVAAQLPTGHMKKAVRHPMLVGVKIWAVGHLLANGDLASLILFLCFLAYAVFDRIMVKRRGDFGPGPDATTSVGADIAAVLIGSAVYVGFVLWLHEWLIGVPVIA